MNAINPPLTPELAHYAALDARMVAAVRGIELLGTVSWPAQVQTDFLAARARGAMNFPQIVYPLQQHAATRMDLESIAAETDLTHPLGAYIARTCESWHVATLLLESLGTPEITEHSIRLFGKPGDHLPGDGPSNIEAAQHFIAISDELDRELATTSLPDDISAETLQADLQAKLDAFFVHHKITVVLDPCLIAKAAAGPTRIRLRTAAAFSEYDRQQLLEHEAFVHSLTALNGREQPYLKSLARSSPRVTATQEGLATFAEQITGAIDIDRMKRISLRIIAIDMALSGASFLDVFDFFESSGQSPTDSFTSAQRVFRGAPLAGGSAFTKDTVYLHGLLSVHTFFRWALRNRRLRLCRLLFAGKMALQDVLRFEPLYDEGFLAPPLYIPPWVQRANGLAGMLAFSLFANKIRLDNVDAGDLVLGL
ncbi:MAG TPA: flavohemoglobin expression-modulating QEGLA motif protein [Xanthomonadaceae bacterium]|nr:flavohemoglobin expression-modulating QEGLA motif protein [Xanthomonadaceae bacterium]